MAGKVKRADPPQKDESRYRSVGNLATELPWMAPVLGNLGRQVQQNTLPAALLINGPAGCGKSRLATQLSAALLCVQAGESARPCGHCKSCLLFAAGTHPDFFVAEPEQTGKDIVVARIRKLAEFASSRPVIASQRTVIIEPAEAMNLNAANAALKTLEEPSRDCTLMLVTAMPARLLPTLRSRCTRVDIAPPDPAAARAWLAQQAAALGESFSDSDRQQALELAGGAPLLALDRLRARDLEVRQEVLQEWRACLAGTRDVFSIAEEWAKMPQTSLVGWLAHALHAQARQDTWGLGVERIHTLYLRLLEINRHDLEGRNLNPALSWESWLMYSKMKPKRPPAPSEGAPG